MIYLDASVALAHLFGETRRPAESLWGEQIISSRLIQYEVWTRVHPRRMAAGSREAVTGFLSGLTMIEMSSAVLERALEPFPVPLRALDAMHLATMTHLRERGRELTLASYDTRLIAAARSLDFEIAEL